MPIDRQIVPIVLDKGLDAKSNNKVGVPGDLIDLRNAVFQTTERLTLRSGYTARATSIQGGGNISSGNALMARQDELLMVESPTAGARLYSYIPANVNWRIKGRAYCYETTAKPVFASQYSITQVDACVHPSGLMMMTAERWSGGIGITNKGACYSIIDTATGNVLASNITISATAVQPKCIVAGSYFLYYYVQAGILRVGVINTTAPSVVVSDSAVTGVVSGGLIDALSTTMPAYDVMYFNGSVYLVFTNNSAANGGTVYQSAAATPATVTASANIANEGGLAWAIVGNQFNNDVVCGYSLGAFGVKAFAYSSTLLAQTLAPTTIDAVSQYNVITGISTSVIGTAIQFVYGQIVLASGAKESVRQNTLGAAYAVGAASLLFRSVCLAGKAFLQDGRVCFPLSFLTGYSLSQFVYAPQSTLFVGDVSGNIVGKAYAGTHGGIPSGQIGTYLGGRQAMLPESTQLLLAQTNTYIPVSYVTRFSAPTPTAFLGSPIYQTCAAAYVKFAINGTTGFSRTEAAQALQIGGSVVQQYDGQSISELNFHYYPYGIACADVAGGMGAGTYQYSVTYEWVDAAGANHLSAPSTPVSFVRVSGGTVVTIPTLRLTAKATPVRICVYRTAANGTVFYRVNNTGNPTVATDLFNDTTVDVVTWTDTLADASITGNSQLYTTGGVLPDGPPPPLSSMMVHRNRVWGVDTTNPTQLQYSKQVVPGLPVEFSPLLFTLNIDPKGGPCAALASMDDKLIVFKSDRIFAVTGQGPDALGAQSDFSDSMLVTVDVGCPYPKSVVLGPAGLMFQSAKGIYLLDRALRVSYVGSPVESINTVPVVSAVLCPNTQRVYFGGNSASNGLPGIISYDYFVGKWSTFGLPGAQSDAVAYGGVHYYLAANGSVYYDSQSASGLDDASNYYGIYIQTAWISLAGILGFQRARRLILEGGCDASVTARPVVTVTIAYDFDTTTAQTVSFALGASALTTDKVSWQERIHLTRQKCEAIQITISSTSSVGAGSNYIDLTAISLECGIKRGLNKMPASASTA